MITLIYFILILGVVVFIHELGHFIFAKKSHVYVYEFSLGMGPKLFGFKRKNDETDYSIRLFPIGGYVKMAGEEVEADEKIPADRRMQSKTWGQRCITVVAGALFNFLLGILLLFLMGLIYGSPETKPYIGTVVKDYPAYKNGIESGDLILNINGKSVETWNDVLMKLQLIKTDKAVTFKIEKASSKIITLSIKPVAEKSDGKTSYIFGIGASSKQHYGFISAVKYSFDEFISSIKIMFEVIGGLITGKVSVNNLSGPVGIYSVVGEAASSGFKDILYLTAFLTINVGFVNLIPFPAFDGGRVLFLVIEKIKGSSVNPKVENTIHAIGMVFLLLLMLLITIKDIRNLF